MKYYSEDLKKVYDTEEELQKAEEENSKKLALAKVEKEERSKDAKAIEDLYNEYTDAQKIANEKYKTYRSKFTEFLKKYGSYHKTFTSTSDVIDSLFDDFFKDFWL